MATDNEAEVRDLVHRWVEAIQSQDLDGVVADHADDVVMFDVPPPFDGIRGIDEYRAAWPPFFSYIQQGADFELVVLDVVAGTEVAYAHGLLRCGRAEELNANPDNRLRLTMGFRNESGRWVIAHEHHSFPLCDQPPGG